LLKIQLDKRKVSFYSRNYDVCVIWLVLPTTKFTLKSAKVFTDGKPGAAAVLEKSPKKGCKIKA
jgi:hypothetical protein